MNKNNSLKIPYFILGWCYFTIYVDVCHTTLLQLIDNLKVKIIILKTSWSY